MKSRYTYIVDWDAGARGKRRWFAQVIDNQTEDCVRFNWCADKAAGHGLLAFWRQKLEPKPVATLASRSLADQLDVIGR